MNADPATANPPRPVYRDRVVFALAVACCAVASLSRALGHSHPAFALLATTGTVLGLPVAVIAVYDFLRRPRPVGFLAVLLSGAAAAYWLWFVWASVRPSGS